MKVVLALVCLLSAAAALAAAPNEGGAVYIAGDGFSLEQAVADAKAGDDGVPASRFAVLAIGPEVGKLTYEGSGPDIRDIVRQAQIKGGTFYLCERDVVSARISGADLLPGVQVVRGWSDAEAGATDDGQPPAVEDPYPLAPLRRITRICTPA
jgi:intracellular sulfur oxidation DsrE/DsrF family protein